MEVRFGGIVGIHACSVGARLGSAALWLLLGELSGHCHIPCQPSLSDGP